MILSTGVDPERNFKLQNVDFVDRDRAREPEIDLPSNPSGKIVWTSEPFASKYDLRVDFIDRGRAKAPFEIKKSFVFLTFNLTNLT